MECQSHCRVLALRANDAQVRARQRREPRRRPCLRHPLSRVTTRRFPVFVTPRAYPHADITGGPPTSWRMAGRERRAHAALRASRTQERHWRGEPFALPCKAQHPAEKAGVGKGAKLKGKAVRVDDHDGPTITAEYGQRRSYNGVEAADGYFHEGVDFACEQGTFVRATQVRCPRDHLACAGSQVHHRRSERTALSAGRKGGAGWAGAGRLRCGGQHSGARPWPGRGDSVHASKRGICG